MADAKLVIDEAAYEKFRTGIAAGMANMLGWAEGEAKSLTPVFGDPTQGGQFSTFAPGARPIGGDLRRSIHHVVYIDGRRQYSGGGDGDIPAYVTGRGVEGFVGTNKDYAVYVHDGTVKMPGRPFLTNAIAGLRGVAADLFSAGYRRIMGG